MRTLKNNRGAAGQQYAIIVGLVGVIALASVSFMGTSIKQLFSSTSNTMTGVVNSTIGAAPAAPTGPNAFSFTDLTNQAQGLQINSNIVQITGIPVSFNVTISGAGTPQFRICADATCTSEIQTWGSAGQSISNNQYLQLRLTAASADNTLRTATVNIGSGSDAWDVTTGVALYTFTSHTFTTCGQTGRFGPTQATCRAAYSTTWDENNSYFTVPLDGYQMWTVPASGNYRIEVAGAGWPSGSYIGPRSGAIIRAEVALTQGEFLLIAVGQKGLAEQDGNGGTFVARGSNYTTATPLIVGGGAAGDYVWTATPGNANGTYNTDYYSVNSTTPANYSGPNGTAGNGGGGYHGGGGGGFFSNGSSNGGSTFGYGFRGGLAGGLQNTGLYGGGFGGAGAYHTGANGCGGGGGYSGGRGGYSSVEQGFGGGSYVDSAMTSRVNVGGNTGDGYVIITRL